MKIISKYKDYYDYLIGVYGTDGKIVLDRRDFDVTKFLDDIKERFKIKFYICGYYIDGLHDNGRFYYGEDLKLFELEKNKRPYLNWYYRKQKESSFIYIRCDGKNDTATLFDTKLAIDMKNVNIENECPIILEYNNCLYKYPILSNLNFQSFMSPDDIYQRLYQWVSERITEKENIIDNRTDTEKLQSKGFDKKQSFRHRK